MAAVFVSPSRAMPRCRSPPLQSDFRKISDFRLERTMFDNTNPYTLRTEIREGITHYYVSFRNGQSALRETEVNRDVYLTIDECRKHEKRQRNFFDRHIEHSDLTDETLSRRAQTPPASVEEAIIGKEFADALRAVIDGLPKGQQRRFILYHEIGLTYEQIAEIEGCSKVSAFRSVSRAEEKIRDVMRNF
jgi:RNA polymerase sigma-70 factor (ECF subfamily)